MVGTGIVEAAVKWWIGVLVVVGAALGGWLVGGLPVDAGSDGHAYATTLTSGQTAHIDCQGDTLRVDRVQEETLAVVVNCYTEATPVRAPDAGNGRWLTGRP